MLACGLISFWLWHEPRDGGNRKSGPSCTCAVWWPAARKRDCVWRCWGLGRRRHVQAVTSLAGCGHRHATRDLSINISAVVPRYWQILQISTRLSRYRGFILYCSQGAQVWITQFYLQITSYMSLSRKRSPDGANTDCGARWTSNCSYYSFVYP